MKTEFRNGDWRLVLDSSEIFPSDPGQGTPAMVYNDKRRVSATYHCAIGTGEAHGYGSGMVEIPQHIFTWLESKEREVDAFLSRDWGQL
jgi:hypothetical protein